MQNRYPGLTSSFMSGHPNLDLAGDSCWLCRSLQLC